MARTFQTLCQAGLTQTLVPEALLCHGSLRVTVRENDKLLMQTGAMATDPAAQDIAETSETAAMPVILLAPGTCWIVS